MKKHKNFFLVLTWMFLPQICFAATLELADKIRDARITQMKLAKSQIQKNVEQTKKQLKYNSNSIGEQNATEILNPNEIMKMTQKSNNEQGVKNKVTNN